MAEIFGWEIKRKPEQAQTAPSFAPKENEDGAVVVQATGGSYGTYIDLEGAVRTEAELVTKYRDMTLHPDIDAAIEDILDEAIVSEDGEKTVTIVLDDVKVEDSVKKRLTEEFDGALKLLEFNTKAYYVFRRWYVDGRIYYNCLVDKDKPKDGIKELRYLDPRKIRKIREEMRVRDRNNSGIILSKIWKEYYIYSDKGLYQNKSTSNIFPQVTSQGVKIGVDAILHVTSGIVDTNGNVVLSYLHKAIKYLNLLRAIEDAIVIYRISRAPERRIFYVDIGDLPKMKAEQYMRDMMAKHKNKLVYDGQTGEIRDDRRFMTMVEDYWIPRREGTKGTEIDTLPAGENLGELTDLNYFQRKLYKSLNVPIGRLEPENQMGLDLQSAISRDEVKFSKFIDRVRNKFSELFLKLMEKQVVLKGIMSPEEWQEIVYDIKFRYLRDNLWSEKKDQEIYQSRANLATAMMPFIGTIKSWGWIQREVFKMTDDDIEQEQERIKEEQANPQFTPPAMNFGDESGPGGEPPPGMGGQGTPPIPGSGGEGKQSMPAKPKTPDDRSLSIKKAKKSKPT